MKEFLSDYGCRNFIYVHELPLLGRLIKKHSRYANLGVPVSIFIDDESYCVRYHNGVWFHYNIKNQTWW